MKKLIVTGSSGLIGSEVCEYFHNTGWGIHGIDNNQRAVFFGTQGDTKWNQKRLQDSLKNYIHHDLDLRDRENVLKLISELRPTAIVHAAAQPSHDLASKIPFDDFDVNAVATLNLLESARRYCKEAPFVLMSTNKVYGDGPNRIPMVEKHTRWDFSSPEYQNGIPESFSIDHCKHSLFGASKVAADIMTQEYGRYFDMPTCCLRGGCLTGPKHSGVELHGFLSYLVRCNVEEREYTVYGYLGKQVRDNIHSLDVARFIDNFISSPKSGAVYNIGGGQQNTCSIVEAFKTIEQISGKKQRFQYIDQPRIGDHICYYSNLDKIRKDYPDWNISISLEQIFSEIYQATVTKQ
jgi:CDP-paratose 2-epimerase